ncbi:MAG TPA: MGMT family protein [Desulfobacterales bacterium]|nr:MGMT family protein [Desulfobacterales bacterium]
MRISDFQERVYRAASRIPRGRVSTYKLLAAAIDCRSPRAVGQALRRNPFAPEVPCHRIIRADLTVGGFMGEERGPLWRRKIELLRREGVLFRHGVLIDAARLYNPAL